MKGAARVRGWFATHWPAMVSLGFIAAMWTIATQLDWVSDLFLPGPDEVWSAFLDILQNGYKSRSLWDHAGLSLERVLTGFVTGAVAGTLLGLGMGYNRKIEALFSPFIEFLRPLPQLSYLVLLIVWFGIGELPQILLLFLTALPVSAVAAMDGVKSTSVQRMQVARTLGASEWHIFADRSGDHRRQHRPGLDDPGCRAILAFRLCVCRYHSDRDDGPRAGSAVAAGRAARGALGGQGLIGLGQQGENHE